MNFAVYTPESEFVIRGVGRYVGFERIMGKWAPILVAEEELETSDGVAPVGQRMIIDPRALIVDVDTGAIVYNPRAYISRIEPKSQSWLKAHREWPGSVELTK
jgi:hypothetical protein